MAIQCWFFKFKNLVAIDIVQALGINSQNFYSNLRFKNLSLICGDSTKSDIIKKADLLGPYDLIFIVLSYCLMRLSKIFFFSSWLKKKLNLMQRDKTVSKTLRELLWIRKKKY